MRKLSLKIKLTAIILALSMLPLIGATLFQLYYFKGSMEKNILSSLEDARINSSTDIENWLKDKLSQLNAIKKAHPEFKNMDVQQTINVVKAIHEISTDLETTMVADKNGECKTSVGTELDVSQRDYFIKVKETKKDYISDILISKVTGKRIIAAISPVLDDSGNFMGIIGSMIDITAIINIVEKIKIGESGYGILMDANGSLISHPEEEFIGKSFKDYSSNPGYLDAYENNIHAKDEGFTSYKDDKGLEKMLIYTTIPSTGWKLLIVAYPHDVYSSVEKSFMLSIIIIAIVLIFVILISIAASILFTRPIIKIADFMKNVSNGNFSEKLNLTRQDEIGALAKSINMMIEAVSRIIVSIREKSSEVDNSASILASTSQEIASASGEVSNSVQDAVEKTSEQMESISEIVNSFKQFDTNLDGIYNLLQNIKQGADTTEKLSNEGSTQIRKLADSVQDIKSALKEEIKDISNLNTDIKKIEEITSFILSISDQTNLLALNAAIEAARAGEAGRGFAVVADEIRKLAEQSKHSSDNITQIVKNVLKSTDDIITTSNDVNERLGAQITTIEQTTRAFEDILSANLDSIPKIKKMYNDTAEIIREKDTIVEKTQNIAKSAEKITNLTQDISSSAEELTASTQEITSISQDLQHISGELIEKNKAFKI